MKREIHYGQEPGITRGLTVGMCGRVIWGAFTTNRYDCVTCKDCKREVESIDAAPTKAKGRI